MAWRPPARDLFWEPEVRRWECRLPPRRKTGVRCVGPSTGPTAPQWGAVLAQHLQGGSCVRDPAPRGRPEGRRFPGCTVLGCLAQVQGGGQGTQPLRCPSPLPGKPTGRGRSQQKGQLSLLADARGTEDSVVWWL